MIIPGRIPGNDGRNAAVFLIDRAEKFLKIEIGRGTGEVNESQYGVYGLNNALNILHRHIGTEVHYSCSLLFYKITKE